jgi:hypothetical protein
MKLAGENPRREDRHNVTSAPPASAEPLSEPALFQLSTFPHSSLIPDAIAGLRLEMRHPEKGISPEAELAYPQPVTAATALDKQIELYRRMTGEQRLSLALDLHELSCDIAREGIRRVHRDASDAEVERMLRRRLALARAE